MTDEKSDQVLSDVHAVFPSQSVCVDQFEYSETRFTFQLPTYSASDKAHGASCRHSETSSLSDNESSNNMYNYDEDGDMIVTRASTDEDKKMSAVNIVHEMATDLDSVGKQVWLGALLLCDFMLHYRAVFEDRVVVDLGAGVGLTSVVAAMVARKVFCTDQGNAVLRLASINVDRNSHLIPIGSVHVCEIDWTAESPLGIDRNVHSSTLEQFRLTDKDVDSLCSSSLILAAEVVYDHELTDAFFRLLYSILLKQPAKVVFMTVEKRKGEFIFMVVEKKQVFTTADREMVSPAYEHFRENLQDLCSVDEGPVRFLCSQVDISFPQHFHYQRTKELELWRIEAMFPRL